MQELYNLLRIRITRNLIYISRNSGTVATPASEFKDELTLEVPYSGQTIVFGRYVDLVKLTLFRESGGNYIDCLKMQHHLISNPSQ